MSTTTPHAASAIPLPSRWPRGICAGTAKAGIRTGDDDDLAVVVVEEGGVGAGVFTRNRFAAAPIEISRTHLERNRGEVRAILLNAGCANAATGPRGTSDAMRSVEMIADRISVRAEQVLVNSTGIIGEYLPIETMLEAMPDMIEASGPATVASLARAIMTTDSAPKGVERRIEAADGTQISIVGVAKGSGMIHPDMATMIGLVTTDAAMDAPTLDEILRDAVDRTFNRVSVDGDTSTNDAVFAIASGRAGPPASGLDFRRAFEEVCLALSRMIVADGEGASRVLEVEASAAASPADAHEVASTVGSSLLVRTAIAGGDANWGRIMAALGRTKAAFDPRRVSIKAGDTVLYRDGAPTMADATSAFAADHVVIEMDLGAGPFHDRHLTCDLTAEYVRINADYRT